MIDIFFNIIPYLFKAIKEYKTSTRIKIFDDGKIRMFIPFRRKIELEARSMTFQPGVEGGQYFKGLERSNRHDAYKLVLERELGKELIITEKFLDDSDMKDAFMLHLLIVKERGEKDRVIYSARTFTNYGCIVSEVKGEDGLHTFNTAKQTHAVVKEIPAELVDPEKCNLCVDRLAMNLFNLRIALRHGFNDSEIRGYFYKKLTLANPEAEQVFALALFSRFDTLKAQYVRLGMNILGHNVYTVFGEQLKHHVLTGSVKEVRTNLRRMNLLISAMFKKPLV